MYAAVFPLLTARALEEPFDYLIPGHLASVVRRGSIVAVPLGAQTVLGVVLELADTSLHAGRHVAIASVVDVPPVPGELLDVAARVRDHYLSTLGAALGLVLPSGGGLRLRRVIAITPEGEAALERGERGAVELLRYRGGSTTVARRPSATASASSAADSLASATSTTPSVTVARRPTRAVTDRLRRRSWLAVSYELHVVQRRDEPRLLAVGEGRPTRLGARQRAALELVRRRRTLDEATLRGRTGLSRQGLARLLADDVLRPARREGRRRGAPGGAAHPGAAEAVPTLLPAQEAALAQILAATGRGEPVLLHGVTGSGKTEVYLRAAEAVLRSGHGVLVLVPEIGLTGQTVTRLRERFPDEHVALVHSGLSAGERLAAWRDAAAGRARVVLGARSAVFAPVKDLGLIVVDEEHDASYKQDNDPRYDARTVAAWRAQASGAALVLGSATPSVEAYARTDRHADLDERVDGSAPPRLEVVDMRDVHGMLSPQLSAAMTAAVEAGEKVILFLNRRGYASLLACNHCGHTWTCPRCDVALAYFARGERLRCRICDYHEPAPGVCPSCHSAELARFGYGTEALEREVAGLLPGIELLRLDSDVAASYQRLSAVLDAFAAPGNKVLVGTQMIAKGHHFPDVTLVGVVNADLTLHFPDFRAEERTFAMLVQVGGRSGRGERPGRVIVQTLDPLARPIALAAGGEHERFYREEIERRQALAYPPAGTLLAVEVSSPAADKAAAGAAFVRARLDGALRGGEAVIGPGPLSRERARYVARVLVKSAAMEDTLPALRELIDRYAARFARRDARLIVDVEPQWL
jgi:primosomal protein N' (replication factor Y) (superfamily II helicase)